MPPPFFYNFFLNTLDIPRFNVVHCNHLKDKELNMSNKEFALFLQLIIKLLESNKTDEVLELLKKSAGEISGEDTKKD